MSVAAGLGACIICESIKRSEFTALTLSISLGAVTPIVMGLHLRNWMAYKCPIKSFIDVPSHGGLALDYNNAAFFLIGLVIMTENFGANQQANYADILLPILGGVFLGYSLSKIRIICSFKTVRSKLGQKNYEYLSPLFFSVLSAQMFQPIYMYPSTARTIVPYTWAQLSYFIVSAVICTIALCSFGWSLQHVEMSYHSIFASMNLVITVISFILH